MTPMRPGILTVHDPEAPASVRERELETGRLVLRAVGSGDPFLVRRTVREVSRLAAGPARRALARAAEGTRTGECGAAQAGLVSYGAVLERHGLHGGALEIYRGVLALNGSDACAALHAGRAARKAGKREDALALYRRAAEQARSDRHLALAARIGEALVSESPGVALGDVVRAARAAGEREALAMAREERARVRARERRAGAALRDLAAAAARYPDRTDRIRVLHAMADLLSARGDLEAAREALLAALEQADASQAGHSIERLRTVARAMGDQVTLRRMRGQGAGGLVMLAPVAKRLVPSSRSLAPRLRRWRSLLGR